jgi:hypothetical protein
MAQSTEVACQMAAHQRRAVASRGRCRPAKQQRMGAEALQAAVRQLDDLGHELERVSAHRHWPAEQWMIATTPFRLQLPRARKRLAQLTTVSAIAQERDIGWALELTSARRLAESQLDDIRMCLHVLHQLGTEPADRVREAEAFVSHRSRFLKSIGRLRCLIMKHFPEAHPGGDAQLNNRRLATVREPCSETNRGQ